MIAKNRETARALSHEFATGIIHKTYFAVGYDRQYSSHNLPSKGVIYSDMAKVFLSVAFHMIVDSAVRSHLF